MPGWLPCSGLPHVCCAMSGPSRLMYSMRPLAQVSEYHSGMEAAMQPAAPAGAAVKLVR